MSDPTLTMKDVRDFVAFALCKRARWDMLLDEGFAAFDSMLAAHDAEVRADEREKCIAIARSRASDLHYCHRDDNCELKAQGIDLAISDIEYAAAARGEGTE